MTPSPQTRAAIGYARVSTIEQVTHGYSLDGQRQKIKAYCEARSWHLSNLFVDEGVSGTEVSRPGFQSARDTLLDGEAEFLLVTKLDRLSRSASLMLSVTEELEAAGVGIVSITEAIDTSTPAGKLFRTILAGVAEFEKEIITERLVAGKRAKQQKLGPAAYIGGPTVPFGFRVEGDVAVRDRFQWPVVERILAARHAGLTLDAIAGNLNRDGITGQRGGQWSAGTLSRLLRSIRRIGPDDGFGS